MAGSSRSRSALFALAAVLIGLVAAGDGAYGLSETPPPGRHRLAARGVYVQFERRGWPAEFWPGQTIQQWNDFDSSLGRTVREEVAIQLAAIRDMGINRITFELRSAAVDGSFTFPTCHLHPVLGFQFPQPTATELANLPAFLDLVGQHGIRVWLRLTNTRMDDRAGSRRWLDAILGVIKDHPALDLVLFEGDTIHVDTDADGIGDACGGQAEPPLWMGPTSVQGDYIRFAIARGHNFHGMPWRKLSAEAIVGSYFLDSEPGNQFATDGHLWRPIVTLKQILDTLQVPVAQRTYAISFYEQRKCTNAGNLACVDLAPHAWAAATLRRVFDVIGRGNGARVVAPEMGVHGPVTSQWPTERAVESLVALMEEHGVQGGAFWRWTSFDNSEDANPDLADPIKRRGIAFDYNPVRKEILDMGGFHLAAIPNGSFELDADANGVPDHWAVRGQGTARRIAITPDVPTRGTRALRLVTGGGAAVIKVVSDAVTVAAGVRYTTVANLKFGWTGDPAPSAEPRDRPSVFVAATYFDAAGAPVAARPRDVFRFFQENATTGYETFVFRYMPPAGAATVRLEIAAARNNLPTPIVLEADNVR